MINSIDASTAFNLQKTRLMQQTEYCNDVIMTALSETKMHSKQAVRVATKYAPPLSSLSGRRSASRRRADRNIAVRSHSHYVPTLTAAAT